MIGASRHRVDERGEVLLRAACRSSGGPRTRTRAGGVPRRAADIASTASKMRLRRVRGIHRDDRGIARDRRRAGSARTGHGRSSSPMPAHPVLDLGDDLGLTVELVDAEVLAKLIDERAGTGSTDRTRCSGPRATSRPRASPRAAVGTRAGAETCRCLPRRRRTRPAPGPRGPRSNSSMSVAISRVSPDEGREAALTLDVQPRRAASRPQDLERLDRHVTFHRQLAEVDRFEEPGDQPMRRVAQRARCPVAHSAAGARPGWSCRRPRCSPCGGRRRSCRRRPDRC